MSKAPETIRKFQAGLEPYIKPREQINYIRRLLALHLGACSHGGLVKVPLGLTDATYEVAPSPELNGLQAEYIDALAANVAALRRFEALKRDLDVPDPSETLEPSSALLELDERIYLLDIRGKRQRLLAIRKYLDLLLKKPAATPEFFNAEHVFRDATSLPSVPEEVVNSLVAERTVALTDAKDLTNRLERAVLLDRLRLKQEHKRLRHARALAGSKSGSFSDAARFSALHATRTELIRWVETELDKAPAADAKADAEGPGAGLDEQLQSHTAVTLQLGLLKEKYADYVLSRKELLNLISQRTSALEMPPSKTEATVQRRRRLVASSQPPSGNLLAPYVEALLSVSCKQKRTIAQKSHAKSALANRDKDTCKVLGHLAEESQLLSNYPMKDSLRRKSGLWNELTAASSGRPELAKRIRPWIVAADMARIASLELIAEMVEKGQVSLQKASQTLWNVDNLLGHEQSADPDLDDGADSSEADLWLRTDDSPPHLIGESELGPEDGRLSQDLWARLHGGLGLLGQED